MAKKDNTQKQEPEKAKALVHTQEKVTIIGTESSPFLKTGKEYKVTATAAEVLVKKGQATLK